MRRKFITILILLTLFLPPVYAETIVFKSGKILKGRIIKKRDREIRVDVGGMLMICNLDEIVSIDGTRVKFYTFPKEKEVLNQGLAYLDSQMYDEAINEFTKAIQINPDFSDAYYNRGLVYAKQGNLDQAVSDYTKAIQIKPDFSDAYYSRGEAYLLKKEYDKAWEDVHKLEALGYEINGFLKKLKRASGRKK